MPPHNISATQGKFLQIIAQMINTKAILEIGTLGAYSTIVLGRALQENGQIVSLEMNSEWVKVAQKNIAIAKLSNKVDIREGLALKSMVDLSKEGRTFDLIFIDANKDQNPDYLLAALQLSRKGTVIVADNVIREGAIIDETNSDQRIQGIRRFNDLVAQHPQLTATTLQTVGAKGYDGFTLALVK